MYKQFRRLPIANFNSSSSLQLAVLRVLSFYSGRDHPISGSNLAQAVGRIGFSANERQVREAVRQLRRAGHLIGSAAGEGGGFFMLTSLQEFENFAASEFHALITDMSQTLMAMQDAAERKWNPSTQPVLF